MLRFLGKSRATVSLVTAGNRKFAGHGQPCWQASLESGAIAERTTNRVRAIITESRVGGAPRPPCRRVNLIPTDSRASCGFGDRRTIARDQGATGKPGR